MKKTYQREGVKNVKRAEENRSSPFFLTVEGTAEEMEKNAARRRPFTPPALLRPSQKTRAIFFSSLHVLHAFM